METETIAKDMARISTVSNSDVQAVLGGISPSMYMRMAQGKSVHIKGLGYFHYVLDTIGVENLEDFNFDKHKPSTHIIPTGGMGIGKYGKKQKPYSMKNENQMII